MSKRLNETIVAVEYDGLIVGNVPVADAVSVKLAANAGVLKRGTIVTGTAGGELSQLSAAIEDTNATYILTDDVDTGTDGAVVATAYRTGHFARGKLLTGSEYALTAADEEILRRSGIMLDEAITY